MVGVVGVVTGVDGGVEVGSPPLDLDVHAPAHSATTTSAPTTRPALMRHIVANAARNGHFSPRICG